MLPNRFSLRNPSGTLSLFSLARSAQLQQFGHLASSAPCCRFGTHRSGGERVVEDLKCLWQLKIVGDCPDVMNPICERRSRELHEEEERLDVRRGGSAARGW